MKTQSIRVTHAWLSRLRQGRSSVALMAGVAAIVVVSLLVPPRSVQAFPSYQTDFAAQYPGASGSRLDSCVLCHVNGPSAGPRNAYGAAYANNGHSFTAIENLDSDGDGVSNRDEISALTFPGDASDKPAAATVTPTVPAPTATPTSVLPTVTTTVAASPTSTSAAPSPTPTLTPPPGAPTPTATAVTSPGGLDLDIRAFKVSQTVELKRDDTDSILIRVDIKASSRTDGQGTATVVGMQNGAEVYRANLPVSAGNSRRTRSYTFPAYLPTASGTITWTATLSDGNPDDDTATAITWVTAREPSDDDEHDGEHDDDNEHDGNSESHGGQPAGTGSNPAADTSAQPTAQPVVNDPTTTNVQPTEPPVNGDPTVSDAPTAEPAATGACTGTHVVQPGENLFRIGFDCGFSLQQMAIANGIAYPYRIYPGQTLTFP